MILTSGRLVEYEGGGDETRSNRWLAEIVQEAYAEINIEDAKRLGVVDKGMVWVYGAENNSKAHAARACQRAHRARRGVRAVPFRRHASPAKSQRGKYPPGTDPIVLGEPVNQLTTYGYDPVTNMQETKVTLCRVEAA